MSRIAADQILHSVASEPRDEFRHHEKGAMATIGRSAAVAELPNGLKLNRFLARLA